MTVSRESIVASTGPLLEYLLSTLPHKRGVVKTMLSRGAVSINGITVRQFDHPLAVGDRVQISDRRTTEAAGRLDFAHIRVVYEDAELIVLDKPAGLLTVGTESEKTDTLFFRLNEYLRAQEEAEGTGPGAGSGGAARGSGGRGSASRSSASQGALRAVVVHRLDRDTSGLVLFAKSRPIADQLQADWPAVEKIYLAVVEGRPAAPQGILRTYLTETTAFEVFSNDHQTEGSQLAITHYRLLQARGPFALIEVRLETGRKHQIRVHLAQLGCKVIGDRRYGAKLNPCRRLGLHAARLAFTHPTTGGRLELESPLPAVLRRTLLWSAGRP